VFAANCFKAVPAEIQIGGEAVNLPGISIQTEALRESFKYRTGDLLCSLV